MDWWGCCEADRPPSPACHAVCRRVPANDDEDVLEIAKRILGNLRPSREDARLAAELMIQPRLLASPAVWITASR